MNVQELKKRLSGGFRPFAIRTTDGQEFVVPHPEFLLIGKYSIAVRDKDTGQFRGVVVDLSRELAKRLDVQVEFATVNSNSVAVDQVKNGQADLTFLVGLPSLAAQIDFGAAYIEYETSFLVPANFSDSRIGRHRYSGIPNHCT